MSSNYKIAPGIYETPSVACYAVLVEAGYASSKRGELENLGDEREEGYW